jgi:CheY-like chemotaxis protein
LLHILARVLTVAGYHVIPVQSGEHALEMLACIQPDLVISDVTLTGISGVELCRRIQAHPRYHRMRVLLITGLALDELPADCTPAAVLQKPIAMTQLLEVIDGICAVEPSEERAR